ncbi:nucleoside hydrolase [Humidisolicoccus flavus]|uniref:nucleoside hydrolase n=1 Tax=Humidisolicoccus flavus TaxID=3111414 RepID=UPI00324C48A3
MPAIILDCDPGHDDAIAMLYAAGHANIELLAVTTVAGNQTIEKVTRNALAVGEIAGLHGVPFARGAGRPLVRDAVVAPEYHGESGLDGPELPDSTIELAQEHAVDLIIRTVLAAEPGSITLVPTGALTNIALAVRKEPRIVELVKEVVLMGGAMRGGNYSASAEYNIAIDPEAAHIVFGAGWNVVMMGLDITHLALADESVQAGIAAIGNRAGAFTSELLEFFTGSYREQGFGWPPVHDVLAVAYVANPSVFTLLRAPIHIELHGEFTTGMTVVDTRRPADESCTTALGIALDVAEFWDDVRASLAAVPDRPLVASA